MSEAPSLYGAGSINIGVPLDVQSRRHPRNYHAKDMVRARAFYEGALGLELIDSDIGCRLIR